MNAQDVKPVGEPGGQLAAPDAPRPQPTVPATVGELVGPLGSDVATLASDGRRRAALDAIPELPRPALPATLQQHMRPCTDTEERAAQLFVLYNSQAQAWREAYGHADEPGKNWHYEEACRVFGRPWVQQRVRELRAEQAAALAIDIQAIVAADMRIVAAAEHSHLLSRFVHRCCRHCHGKGYAYQWVDELEYCNALVAAEDANNIRHEQQKRALPLPGCEGGFGFDPETDPNPACPRCEGVGIGRAVIGDTRYMGAAAPLFRGIKQTANGIEVQTHDVDKAKERILRVVGAFGDDAASVARGAAAGAAAGASAGAAAQAIAAAKAAEALTAEQAQRLYLQVING